MKTLRYALASVIFLSLGTCAYTIEGWNEPMEGFQVILMFLGMGSLIAFLFVLDREKKRKGTTAESKIEAIGRRIFGFTWFVGAILFLIFGMIPTWIDSWEKAIELLSQQLWLPFIGEVFAFAVTGICNLLAIWYGFLIMVGTPVDQPETPTVEDERPGET